MHCSNLLLQHCALRAPARCSSEECMHPNLACCSPAQCAHLPAAALSSACTPTWLAAALRSARTCPLASNSAPNRSWHWLIGFHVACTAVQTSTLAPKAVRWHFPISSASCVADIRARFAVTAVHACAAGAGMRDHCSHSCACMCGGGGDA